MGLAPGDGYSCVTYDPGRDLRSVPQFTTHSRPLGEMIPVYLARVDEVLTPASKRLQRRVTDYFLQQVYVAPSGMFTLPPFLLTLQVMGADRIMYAVDYPYIAGDQARAFLETAPISPADKEKIAHGNAEKLLKISPR